MERQKYNRKIISKLTELVEKYPDLRFGQILVNADIITYKNDYDEMVPRDPYYEEPEVTLERIKNNKFAFKELFN